MANEAEVKLLTTRFSPFGQRVQIALLEKGIPFELITVDLANKPKLLLEANPVTGKIPVIIHNNKPVVESLVILQYLEDAWPEQVPLMPKDAHEKSQVRFWCEFVYQTYFTFGESIKSKSGSPERHAANKASVKVLKTLDAAMASFSAEGPFFTGDKFGLVDVVLAPLSNSIRVLETGAGIVLPGRDELPRLHKWIEVVKVRPSVSSTLPSGEETGKYLSDILQKRAAAAAQGAPAK